ncbi:HAD hydrolase-like protein [Sagittula sp. NFXS13]|uniref:HAD-IIA family hydrolase n=1 Tax=Sagittula sp. NFXS13 TaxID=2819095 RepID=UPI0032DFBFDF
MITTEAAFARYERLRPMLPQAQFPEASRTGQTLEDTKDDYDAYILDAFGVLNRGETPIPGAVERIARLRAAGKRLVVLTNAASYTRSGVLAKYHRLGFDFSLDEVVSSRDVAFAHLPNVHGVWAAITDGEDDLSDLPPGHYVADLLAQPGLLNTAAGFLFLSAARWSHEDNARLRRALHTHARPVIVANPDIVAPRDDGLSLEPGWYAQDIASACGLSLFGKPYWNAFEAALQRLPGIPRHRIAMVGDTLHTDVLGGAAAGLGTILIQKHGLFRGLSPAPFIESSGIQPDWLVEST